MFEELGISFGTALIVLLALYFIVKWAVKNGIREVYILCQVYSWLKMMKI